MTKRTDRARRARRSTVAAIVAVAATIGPAIWAGCSSMEGPRPSSRPHPRSATVDGLRLDQVQVVGTHNSYHVAPDPEMRTKLRDLVERLSPGNPVVGEIAGLDFTHDPLATQLDRGIRSFELDLWADPAGGRFRRPRGPEIFGSGPPPPDGLDVPGFKVLHLPDFDYSTTCATFRSCLTAIDDWSTRHPGHLPITVDVELKDEGLPFAQELTTPVTYDPPLLNAVDEEIRDVVPAARLITPDDVRGGRATLRERIVDEGWPTIGELRGRILFFMDNGEPRFRESYLAGHPSLRDRVMFTTGAPAGADDRAVVKLNDPTQTALVRSARDAGFLVRTRADVDLGPAGNGDAERRDVALAGGAHIVSTDFPVGGAAADGYVVTLGDGPVHARCNPARVTRCPTGRWEP